MEFRLKKADKPHEPRVGDIYQRAGDVRFVIMYINRDEHARLYADGSGGITHLNDMLDDCTYIGRATTIVLG